MCLVLSRLVKSSVVIPFLFVFIFNFQQALAQDTIKLNKYISNLKTVDVYINGVKYVFLFDTGGGDVFISPEIASKSGKQSYGNSHAFRMSGEKISYQKCDSITLKIGRNKYFNQAVGVWDLMSILPAGLPRVDGVISLKTFSDNIISLDLSKSILIVETRASANKKKQSAAAINAKFATGLSGDEINLFLGIERSGHTYWFLFDSGNLDNIRLSATTAMEWGLQSDTSGKRMEHPAMSIRIGKRNFEVAPVTENIIYDGALNYDIISKAVFLIDLKKKETWLY